MQLPTIAMLACSLGTVLSASPAAAEDRPASKGIYAEAGVGARGFLGDASRYSAVGPTVTMRIGYDLFSWFSIGGRGEASIHQATVPAPPEGEYYQLYTVAGEARLSTLIGRIALFADGGIGFSAVSTNVLQKVMVLDPGESVTLSFQGGGGLEYQLQNRHYAFGLAGQYTLLPEFDASSAVSGRAYLRYTY